MPNLKLHMRGNSDPTAALLLIGGVAFWTFFKGFRVMREYKVLEDTPRIPIRSVPLGFVHIRGKAEGSELLSSPVSHTPCCFYKVEIDQWKSEGKSHNWVRCCNDFNGYQFHVDDGTGKILIDAHAAEYDLPIAATREVSSLSATHTDDSTLLQYVSFARMHSMTDRMSQFVDKRLARGVSDNPQMQAKRDAFRQLFAGISNVQQGGKPPIAAIETLFSATGPLSDPEKEQKRQMILGRLHVAEAANQSGLLAQLMPPTEAASGRFRLREYVVTPGQEYLISGTCVENSDSATTAADRSIIAKGQNEPTFVISTKSDTQIHHALKKRALLMIFGGAAVTLACTAALLAHLGLF